jgi:Na+-driven multidrug efflux pump
VQLSAKVTISQFIQPNHTCIHSATSFLGPAEVAAWGILGTQWDALEFVTEAIADAAEVRTAFLLGAGKPAQAKLSSCKALYLALFATLFITACLFIAGEQIPTWMTTDLTLQHLVADLIPLFGIGNIALSIGTLSWTLVGAQGRYRLATTVGFAGSWLVTIPLSVITSVVLNLDLQGQTAAIVIGYMVSGTLYLYTISV